MTSSSAEIQNDYVFFDPTLKLKFSLNELRASKRYKIEETKVIQDGVEITVLYLKGFAAENPQVYAKVALNPKDSSLYLYEYPIAPDLVCQELVPFLNNQLAIDNIRKQTSATVNDQISLDFVEKSTLDAYQRLVDDRAVKILEKARSSQNFPELEKAISNYCELKTGRFIGQTEKVLELRFLIEALEIWIEDRGLFDNSPDWGRKKFEETLGRALSDPDWSILSLIIETVKDRDEFKKMFSR